MRRLIVSGLLVLSLIGAVHVAAYGNPVFPYYDKYPCPDGYPVKGNQTTYNGQWIYHVPGGDFYNVTSAEECFVTEDDAVASGYRRSFR